jgi:hypothetical protein
MPASSMSEHHDERSNDEAARPASMADRGKFWNASGGPAAWFGKVAREWGIFAAMTVFFMWQSMVREGALNARYDAQNEFVQKTLVTTIDNNTRAFGEFRAAIAALKDKK